MNRSPTGIPIKPYSYETFMGLDVTRPEVALETGHQQHLIVLNNGFADNRGIITRDYGAIKRTGGNRAIDQINFYDRDKIVWAERSGGGITLKAEDGTVADEVYDLNSILSTTVFNANVHFASRGQPIYSYNGVTWERNKSPSNPNPAYIVTVQRRLAMAGIPGYGREVWLSRVDNAEKMPLDEPANSDDVLRAGSIDVRNVIGTADEIRGLGVFEVNKLAIFTADQTIIYTVDPSLAMWKQDDKSSLNIGTISHNTIKQVGTDLIFGSASGVYALRRSESNGITVYPIPMSIKVEHLYRRLVSQVADKEKISAAFDKTLGQYHLFFPMSGDVISKRLTLTMTPFSQSEHKWSTGTFLNARCGVQLGDTMLFGTSGGIYQVAELGQFDTHESVEESGVVLPEMTAETPVLWCGSINDTKESHSLIVQAAGSGGDLLVEAYDVDKRRIIFGKKMKIEPHDDGEFPAINLFDSYEIKFEQRFRGIRLRFTLSGPGHLRIIGFAVMIKQLEKAR